AAGLANRPEDDPVGEGRGDTESRRLGPRHRPGLRRFPALFPGSDERRATFGLNDPEARPDALVPTELAQFVERLPHPDDSGPTSGREKDPVRHPAKG